MNSEIPQAIRDSADVSAITQLILKERESRDLGEWSQMLECFHPDSNVEITWFKGSGPDFVKGSIDMAKRGVLAKHRLAPIRVTLAGDRALASLMGIIDIPTVIDGVELMLSAYGRFLYRTEKRQGEWRIDRFECVYIRDELVPVILGQSITVELEEMKGFRTSYRNLAYSLSKSGYSVNQDLPGEDKPETVTRLMAKIHRWLSGQD